MYIIGFHLRNGKTVYASYINMRCKEDNSIILTSNIDEAKRYDYDTAVNIKIMGWFHDIGSVFIEEIK
jgi:hypothetical protein